MLTLLLGTAGTGKTYTVLQEVKSRAQQKQYSILLVPEQFSAAMEGRLYHVLGDELSGFVTSCSFRTLGERILDHYGGGELPLMSEAGRAVLVRRAMDALEPEQLGKFGGQKRSAAFCAACADIIQEMKTAGVSPDFMEQVGKNQPRLRQLGLIYAAYQSLLENTALDPADRLTIAAQKVEKQFFQNQKVFLDGFDGFTAPQYEMLQAMTQWGTEVVVSLCCPGISGGESFFIPAQETARRLSRMAARVGVKTHVQQLQQNFRHGSQSGMAQLTDALTQGVPLPAPPENIFVTPCIDSWQQAKQAAAILAEKARKGLPYSKMVVVCRDKQAYLAPMRWECNLMGVPLFEDEPALLQFSPCAGAVTAAVRIARWGMNSQDVLSLLKTGLVGEVTMEQISLLENYTQVWFMRAQDWKQPLPTNRTLSGFEGNADDPQEQYEMQCAEAARSAVAPALEAFVQATAGARTTKGMNGGKFCRALYELLEQIGAPAQIQILAEQASQKSQAAGEEVQRMWEAAMQLLEELYRLLDKQDVTASEFAELLNLMLRSTELGRIPQQLEGVLLTTADRLQPQGIACCIVLGANEGEFPQTVGASGLLTHADRDLLKEAGANLPGEFEQRVHQEQLYFYRTATAATQSTYFFYQQGQPHQRLSQPLAEIKGKKGFAQLQLSVEQLCQTPQSALDWMCGKGGEEVAHQLPAMEQEIEKLAQSSDTPVFRVEDSLAMEQLLGMDLSISPSRMERFYRCKLSYFLEHIVRLKVPRPAKLDSMLSGSLVHYILEKALQDATFLQQTEGGDSHQQMQQLAERLAEEYIQQLPQDDTKQPLTRREQNTIRRIVEGMVPLLEFLQQEQRQSKFHPIAYEMSIGAHRGDPGMRVALSHNHWAHLTGKIDRVDSMGEKNHCWLRVVDYKTGNKKFSLDNVYYGLDTQMLLYLFSLCSPHGKGFAESSLPAGVVYFLVSPSKTTLDREKANAKAAPAFELHGLITDEPEVYEGMDPNATGKYVPFGFKKDGQPDTRSKSKRISRTELLRVCTHLRQKLQDMGTSLYDGQIEADPLKSSDFDPCAYCPYGDLCRRMPDSPMRQIQGGEGEAFREKEESKDQQNEQEKEEKDG